jgi:PAS domain S-box-containing protein
MFKVRRPGWPRLPFLYLAFLLILVVMSAMVVLALGRVGLLNERTELIQQQSERTQALHQMRDAVRERFIRLNLITLSEDAFLQDELKIEFDLFASRFMVARTLLEGWPFRTMGEAELFGKLREMTTHGTPIQQSVLEAALAGDQARARSILVNESMPIQMGVMAQMDRIFEYFEMQNSLALADLERDLGNTHRAIGVLAVVQILLVLFIAAWVLRRVQLQQVEMRHEIDRRQRSEQALQRAKEDLEQRVQQRTADLNRFKSTLDQTLDCVFMFDAEEMRFFYANEGALRQVGYNRDELLTMYPHDIKPDISESKFRELIAPLQSGEQDSLTFETVHQHKDGQRLPVEIFLQYMAPEGEPARFVAIVRDISERKRIDRMKNEFISTVSHELRTPLTAISGALGLVVGGAAGTLPEKIGEMLGIAHKNSQRLGILINDLLDMERLVAGKMRFVMQEHALHPLLEQSIRDNQAYADHYSVRLVLDSVDEGVRVEVDADRLHQALTNLLSNAAKFSPEGGEVLVSVATDEEHVRVSVTDRGPGIPQEFRERIFHKFSQADASDSRQKGGSGLGLTITRELVNRMGGTVGFDSVPGEGAVFHIELPLAAGRKP